MFLLFDNSVRTNSLNIRYGDIRIKQYQKVTYLGCILYNNLSGESMATKLLGLINRRLSKNIQTSQYKCIRYCLKLENRAHVGINEFKETNWLPMKKPFGQYVCTNIFKFFRNTSPEYVSELYRLIQHEHSTNYICHTETAIMTKRPFLSSDQLTCSFKIKCHTFKHEIRNCFWSAPKKENEDA